MTFSVWKSKHWIDAIDLSSLVLDQYCRDGWQSTEQRALRDLNQREESDSARGYTTIEHRRWIANRSTQVTV